MRKWILVAIMASPLGSIAQLKSSIDTFSWKENVILAQRSTLPQIDSFRSLSRIAFQVGGYIIRLQRQLNEARQAVRDNREIYDYTISAASEEIQHIKEFYPRFDVKIFENELAIYRKYKAEFEITPPPADK